MTTTWEAVCAFVETLPGVSVDGDSASIGGHEFLTHFGAEQGMRIQLSAGERNVVMEQRDPAIYLMADDPEGAIRVTLTEFELDELEELLREARRIAEYHA